jgi:hypothetical protein
MPSKAFHVHIVRLPNVENAAVEDLKLSGYLLAFDHPEGPGKA